MNRIAKKSETISAGLLATVIFVLPFSHKYIAPLIGFWVLSTIVSIIVSKPKLKPNNALISLIIFYILLVVGLLWTSNMKSGTFDLEVKMSLLIFPLIFLYKSYSIKHIKWILISFFIGLLLSSFYFLLEAFRNFLENGNDFNTFLYADLSYKIHPTYMSLYYATAIIIMLIDLIKKRFLKNNWLYVILIIYFYSYNLLLLSKVGIVTVTLLIFVFIVFWSVRNRNIILPSIAVLALVGILLFSYNQSAFIQHRMGEFVYGLSPDPGKKNNGSTGIRLQIWHQGIDLIKEKPLFGYGTGDVKDVLMKRYDEVGMTSAYNKKLNAHNQFIQVTISLGIMGFLIFAFVLIEPIWRGLKQDNLFIVSFVLMFIAYALTESVLENQAGTIFFGFLFSLLNQNAFFTNDKS